MDLFKKENLPGTLITAAVLALLGYNFYKTRQAEQAKL